MSVHPKDVRVMEEIDRCVHDLGLRGIKLGPNYQNFDSLGGPGVMGRIASLPDEYVVLSAPTA